MLDAQTIKVVPRAKRKIESQDGIVAECRNCGMMRNFQRARNTAFPKSVSLKQTETRHI